MGHEHHHHEVSGKNLFWTIVLNLGITIAEAIGGFLSGSMALLSDATHNFSDVFSLIISYIANKLAKKKATDKNTFGFKRSEILAAFLNSATLIVLAIFILYEAITRLFEPTEISANWVIWMAAASIVVNALSVLFIKKDAKDNINMKSAYLHLFSDMLTSIAVLIGGLAMKFLNWYWVDSVFSIFIAIYLIYMSWGIFKESLQIIMQFTPHQVDIKKIAQEASTISGLKNLHHVHVWQINEHDLMFEAHLDVDTNIKITEFEAILDKLKTILKKYQIEHITIQPEYSVDDDKQIIHQFLKQKVMINPKDWLEFGQKFHGHKCPAMPMGLRVGAAAMNKLGVDRTGDGDILAILELGEDHCATCFADGIQVITGCTYGKGNITKTHKGKWGVTLIEKKTKRAVRITPTATAMMANKQSPFFTEYRGKGVPATKVPAEIVEPLVERVMNLSDEDLFNITEVFECKFEAKPHSFNGFVCEECGEMTVMEYGRVKGDKKVCIDCANN